MVALGLAGIGSAEATAALEFRHNQVYELFDGAWAIDGRKHEPVAAGLIEERLQLVGDTLRRAHELRQAHALAVALGNFTDGHRLPVLFLVDPARALEFGLVPTHHVVVGRQLGEVEIEVARQDCHAALQRH